ncbi:hypothetical protein, partial [Mycobacterium tuberculosis]
NPRSTPVRLRALQRVEHRAQSQQWATEKGDS